MNRCIVILTAIPEEQEAVLKYINKPETVRNQETGTIYYKGHYNTKDGRIDIIVGKTNQTNVNAASETERAINYFKPSHIFFVGVAGGLKDVSVGDIVIGDDVIGYERGKAEEQFKPRFQFGLSSYDLVQTASSLVRSDTWKNVTKKILDTQFSKEINVYTGTIASGESVIASEKAELYKFLKTNMSHALAVEMEGLGFLNSCRAYPQLKSLLLRGISDLINDKGEMDGKGSQPYAAQNIAAFLFELISELNSSNLELFEDKKMKDKIFEIACKIYPKGVEDKGIWLRAGGDLSLLILNSTGKAQWIEALRLIENGGGGNIDFKSLLKCMLEDSPNSIILNDLIMTK